MYWPGSEPGNTLLRLVLPQVVVDHQVAAETGPGQSVTLGQGRLNEAHLLTCSWVSGTHPSDNVIRPPGIAGQNPSSQNRLTIFSLPLRIAGRAAGRAWGVSQQPQPASSAACKPAGKKTLPGGHSSRACAIPPRRARPRPVRPATGWTAEQRKSPFGQGCFSGLTAGFFSADLASSRIFSHFTTSSFLSVAS